MNPHIWWYVARAGGLVAWILAGLSIALGLFLAGRRPALVSEALPCRPLLPAS